MIGVVRSSRNVVGRRNDETSKDRQVGISLVEFRDYERKRGLETGRKKKTEGGEGRTRKVIEGGGEGKKGGTFPTGNNEIILRR